MTRKPTYEELLQKVEELEQEKRIWMKGKVNEISGFEAEEIQPDVQYKDALKKMSSLGSIINVEELQSIMDDFHHLTGMVTAILDMEGNVIAATGWQDICTQFHRIHPKTAQNCTESDLYLVKNIKPGEYIGYQCKNGLWDVATPLYVGNKHMGNIYTGQFFYDDDSVDETKFIQQAEKYGFDKNSYMEAFRRIPRYSRQEIKHLMGFLVKFTSYISSISYAKKKLEMEIHERKHAEEALQVSEGRLRALIKTLPDLIWLKDMDGRYLACNARFEQFFGAKEKEIQGKTDYDFVNKELADFFCANDRAAIEKGGPSINEEEITFADDGHKEVLETIKTPMYSKNGRVLGVLGIGRDITERTRAEKERQRLQTQLNHAQKIESVGRLAGGVAHDFNNMLSIILGNSEILMDDLGSNHKSYSNIKEIQKAARRSADLTRQLLAFARKQTTSPKIIDLNKTIEGMLGMLKRLIGEDIDLSWHPKKNLWPVKIDPSQVDQILANLCMNARDSIKDVGKVTIETDTVHFDKDYCERHQGFQSGDYVLIGISDNGCGMDKKTIDNLFEPFFTTKEIGEGTGLGLATVYGIVKQNDGFINVYSEPGKGTLFKLYIPRHERCRSDNSATVREESQKGLETILLVEDDMSILRMTKTMLERLGYTVLAANTPDEAINISKTSHNEIHLLLTDVVMPSMNGRDLAENILKTFPKMKNLYMSGYTANVIAHRGILDEGLNFISKPFSKQELSKKLREILD